MDNVLFYIGMSLILIALVPLLWLSAWFYGQKKRYADMPMKLQELKADYRSRRMLVFIVQMVGLVLAMVGLLL